MSRPRIIMADTDVNYIQSLQLKFIEEFFEKIDLEIITERKYFDELFSVPQKAEILVVSEDLYESSLQRHNISKVFLMVEQDENDGTEELNVNKIFKYSSIKEIFNEILGKSASVLNVESDEKQEPQIIVVTSASGGVGKTTVAMGLSASLAKNYKKVLYINSEQLQTFQYLLKNQTPIASTEVYAKFVREKEEAYKEVKYLIRTEIFSYLPPFKAALMSLGMSVDIYSTLAAAAKKSGDFDFVVIDTDSVFDNKKAKLLSMADKVIFVTNQNKMSVMATNVLAENINGINSEKYFYICNNFEENKENTLSMSEVPLRFSINEYIGHIEDYDKLKSSDFVNYTGFQKAAYLFI